MKSYYNRGATLIELIVTLVVIAVLSAVTAGIVVTLMQLFVYLPSEMNARQISHDIAEQIMEGEPGKRGARYAISITTATNTQIAYTVGYPSTRDQYTMTFTYNTGTDKVNMQVGSGSTTVVPYYASSNITVSCPADKFFTYYKADKSAWNPATETDTTLIRRVEITYTVATGSGVGQSSFTTTSGTDVKQYI